MFSLPIFIADSKYGGTFITSIPLNTKHPKYTWTFAGGFIETEQKSKPDYLLNIRIYACLGCQDVDNK